MQQKYAKIQYLTLVPFSLTSPIPFDDFKLGVVAINRRNPLPLLDPQLKVESIYIFRNITIVLKTIEERS